MYSKDCVFSHYCCHSFLHMNLLAVTQREVRVAGPGEGAEPRRCSGRAVSAAEATQTEALSGDSLENYQSPLAGRAQSGRSIYDLKSDRRHKAHSRVVIQALFNGKTSPLTFINLPHVSEEGVQLCRRSIILRFIWDDFL